MCDTLGCDIDGTSSRIPPRLNTPEVWHQALAEQDSHEQLLPCLQVWPNDLAGSEGRQCRAVGTELSNPGRSQQVAPISPSHTLSSAWTLVVSILCVLYDTVSVLDSVFENSGFLVVKLEF